MPHGLDRCIRLRQHGNDGDAEYCNAKQVNRNKPMTRSQRTTNQDGAEHVVHDICRNDWHADRVCRVQPPAWRKRIPRFIREERECMLQTQQQDKLASINRSALSVQTSI